MTDETLDRGGEVLFVVCFCCFENYNGGRRVQRKIKEKRVRKEMER